MRRHWILVVFAILYLAQFSQSANDKIENATTALVESMKAKLQELEAEVKKQYESDHIDWQVGMFQKWLRDSEKCPRIPAYIFNDWTVIQRRMDGAESFHRNWLDYRNGFGSTEKDFFIGLEKLHSLTNKEPHELFILLADNEGMMAYAKYDNFVVAGEQDKYELKELGEYSGDSGDALRYHVGKKFSTFDEDNSGEKVHCENVWTGGWWFGSCFESNLNGNYMQSSSGYQAHKGIVWELWHGSQYSLKFAQMMIRPKN